MEFVTNEIIAQTIPRILQIRPHKFLEYFGLFLPRTRTSQIFLLTFQKSFSVFFIKRETMTEITCKSYATYSILYSKAIFSTSNYMVYRAITD